MGQHLVGRLKELAARHELVGDVRGLGLMVGMELVRDRQTREPAVAARNELVQSCFRRGLLLLGCGESTLRFCPPLVIDRQDVDTAVGIVDEALAEVGRMN